MAAAAAATVAASFSYASTAGGAGAAAGLLLTALRAGAEGVSEAGGGAFEPAAAGRAVGEGLGFRGFLAGDKGERAATGRAGPAAGKPTSGAVRLVAAAPGCLFPGLPAVAEAAGFNEGELALVAAGFCCCCACAGTGLAAAATAGATAGAAGVGAAGADALGGAAAAVAAAGAAAGAMTAAEITADAVTTACAGATTGTAIALSAVTTVAGSAAAPFPAGPCSLGPRSPLLGGDSITGTTTPPPLLCSAELSDPLPPDLSSSASLASPALNSWLLNSRLLNSRDFLLPLPLSRFTFTRPLFIRRCGRGLLRPRDERLGVPMPFGPATPLVTSPLTTEYDLEQKEASDPEYSTSEGA